MIDIKLTTAQLDALEIAGAFEEPIDEDGEFLAASISDGRIATTDPARMFSILMDLGNGADDFCEGRAPCDDAILKRMYKSHRDIFYRLAQKCSVPFGTGEQ